MGDRGGTSAERGCLGIPFTIGDALRASFIEVLVFYNTLCPTGMGGIGIGEGVKDKKYKKFFLHLIGRPYGVSVFSMIFFYKQVASMRQKEKKFD